MAAGGIQAAFSIDTTGSMARALPEVRAKVTDMIRFLKRDIPGIQLAAIAHGDYDTKDPYVTKHQDFTRNESTLVRFVQGVEETGGHGPPECYELVLRVVRTQLSWRKSSQKILVVIGDAYPHPPEDSENEDSIDWEEETRMLAEMPVRIYGAQIGDDIPSTEFFRKLTQMTGGSHFNLTEFSVLTDVIMAVCYRTQGKTSLKAWEHKVRAQYAPRPLHKDLEGIFSVLHQPLAVPTVPTAPINRRKKKKKKKKANPSLTYRGKYPSFSWGGSITASQPLTWNPHPDDDDDDHDVGAVHSLHVLLAVLGPETKAHEANIVHAETKDFREESLSQPVVHMIGAKDTMKRMGLRFNSPVTFRLVSGSGPVYLSGQHVVTVVVVDEEEEEEEEEEEWGTPPGPSM
ncbi:uncharacterized protein LOC143276805 isoform X2 [Babylonia areolata]